MTLDVYRGRKTTMQQQQQQISTKLKFNTALSVTHMYIWIKIKKWLLQKINR